MCNGLRHGPPLNVQLIACCPPEHELNSPDVAQSREKSRHQAEVTPNEILSSEDQLIRKQMMLNAADIKACVSIFLHIFKAHAKNA